MFKKLFKKLKLFVCKIFHKLFGIYDSVKESEPEVAIEPQLEMIEDITLPKSEATIESRLAELQAETNQAYEDMVLLKSYISDPTRTTKEIEQAQIKMQEMNQYLSVLTYNAEPIINQCSIDCNTIAEPIWYCNTFK